MKCVPKLESFEKLNLLALCQKTPPFAPRLQAYTTKLSAHVSEPNQPVLSMKTLQAKVLHKPPKGAWLRI